MSFDLTIRPDCPAIGRNVGRPGAGWFAGHSLAAWRAKSQRELGLSADRPVIATGHQTLLWHPGILAKYLLVDAMSRRYDLATANLVVDQHAGDYASFEVPIRRSDGALAVRRLHLAQVRKDEPMALHEPFVPPDPPRHLPVALPHVQIGIDRIYEACAAHRDAPNAALQMARVLADLMSPWVRPMPNVTASDLVETSLARAMMQAMIVDPHRCAESYNEAVRAIPEAGIEPLLVRADYVGLPLWRIREDGRRMHAYDNDVEAVLNRAPGEAAPHLLMPRALFMTALIRLGMCDLYVHGTGGANYDRAMERWVGDWLGLEPAPIAVATATLRLDLAREGEERLKLAVERDAARHAWHDPQAAAAGGQEPSAAKRRMLDAIDALPRKSLHRRRAFHFMHRCLAELRDQHADAVEVARNRAERARRQAEEEPIITRRTWAFPLFEEVQIDALAEAIRARVSPCPAGA